MCFTFRDASMLGVLMEKRLIEIKNEDGTHAAFDYANVEPGFVRIGGKEVELLFNPARKIFEARFVKGNISRLYP